ncbi:hypothetical protein D3C72_1423970 [compost metagenome]
MARAAQHLAARFLHETGGIAFQRFAEYVIGGDEVPGLAAGLHHAFHDGVRQGVGVGRPLRAERAALLAAEVARKAAADQRRAAFFPGNALRGQPGRTGAAIHHGNQALRVEPAAHQRRGHVRLVLVVGAHHFHGLARHLAAEVLDGHAHRHLGTLSA